MLMNSIRKVCEGNGVKERALELIPRCLYCHVRLRMLMNSIRKVCEGNGIKKERLSWY